MTKAQTEFEKELDERSTEYAREDFKNNPDGYTVAPYVNAETTPMAFEAGAHWALRSKLVAGLVEAIEKSIARSDDYGDSHCSQPIRKALTAYQHEIKEMGDE